MIVTKKAMSRRTVLKSAHAVLALPLLDAMIPAATAWTKTPARPVRRLGFVYMPMGCDHARWTPLAPGSPPRVFQRGGVEEPLPSTWLLAPRTGGAAGRQDPRSLSTQ